MAEASAKASQDTEGPASWCVSSRNRTLCGGGILGLWRPIQSSVGWLRRYNPHLTEVLAPTCSWLNRWHCSTSPARSGRGVGVGAQERRSLGRLAAPRGHSSPDSGYVGTSHAAVAGHQLGLGLHRIEWEVNRGSAPALTLCLLHTRVKRSTLLPSSARRRRERPTGLLVLGGLEDESLRRENP
ncbi:hypothetical protein GWK47_016148 [Chionoecetes opilio]|uniref:Uncharacterized protein n=1 Tax=Chionoecetes opilio TaxID=41210 RepID=A0A8J4XTN2_CHIOP|nr:hypothetical protein GWK47_016148 [Chionoecetes opilio]